MLDAWQRVTTDGVQTLAPRDLGVIALLAALTIAPLWSLRDSKGFRRRSLARRSLWRRIAYRLTALPGLLLAAVLGIAFLVVGLVLLGVAWLIGRVSNQDSDDELVGDIQLGEG